MRSTSLPVSMISAALVAALVGYGSTIALVLAAAAAVGADAGQTASWVAAICFSKAIGSALLSSWKKVPMVLAWSTPGAALIAASTGVDIHQAAGAFIFAGGLITLTAAIRPLNRAVNAIPTGVASGMLAGVLLPFTMAVALHAASAPVLVLPLIAVFLLVRLVNPLMAVLAALVAGLVIAFSYGGAPPPSIGVEWTLLTFIAPHFDPATLLGLGLPLYLVTMASQNLPGFAVLRANGYEPPVTEALSVTGVLSSFFALFGAHTINMAAITAAICLGDDVHPDRSQRWKVGVVYALVWTTLGLSGPVIVPAILAMPPEIIAVVAGLALIPPLIGALVSAFEAQATRFAAAATFAVTASGVAAFGIGAAFWGLLAGLLVHVLDQRKRI
ncbi:benzoate/H(+) symporter BenE family transporter [Hoeflea sp. YIM 152468]|uniref:benzoate/H(+) symporter BenE family transporter n=1 Tax=Hoeflea sp. YIM 152468 TaxID=3031759 RepID=UPI0023D9B518|nr:benzoate/H(+) symporter BenE family transporter [Hoeflea sp. YIM 152468]MDF1608736.1 benzoate/H(+) symporter BenE family transporter [Hoeflea sp. YIM 152468]